MIIILFNTVKSMTLLTKLHNNVPAIPKFKECFLNLFGGKNWKWHDSKDFVHSSRCDF